MRQSQEQRSGSQANKIALVTGGGRGLGEALSFSLAEMGMNVQVIDRDEGLAQKTVNQILEQGHQASAYGADIGDTEKVRSIVSYIAGEKGRIDVVVNNAGTDRTVPIEEMQCEDWDRIMSTNLRGPFLVAKETLPILKKQGSGHIFNICSTASKRTWPNASAYHASKWGLLGFSHALHTECKDANVKVTAVICGGMKTPFLTERFSDLKLDTLLDPMDVARTIGLLLSMPAQVCIPEVMVLPTLESSWP